MDKKDELQLLVVDGIPPQSETGNNGHRHSSSADYYRDALLASGVGAQIDVIIPFSMSSNEIAGCSDRLASYDGFALTGSNVPFGAEDAEALPYLAFLEKLFEAQKPVIGSCWGMQSVAVLFGGSSTLNPAGTETGIAREIELTSAGRNHYIFAGVEDCFCAPAIHRDHVARLPDCATLLAANRISPVQAFAIETDRVDYVGFQFHPELPLQAIHQWYSSRDELPNTIEVHADFPDEVPLEVADPAKRLRPLTNWMKRLQSK